jgi:chromosome segregation ATPase
LKKEIESLKTEISTYKKKLKKREEKLKEDKESIDKIGEKNEEELRNEIMTLLDEKRKNEEVLNDAELMIETLDTDIKEKDEEISHLNELVNTQKEEKIMLLNNLNELTLTVKNLEETISILKKQKNELKSLEPVDNDSVSPLHENRPSFDEANISSSLGSCSLQSRSPIHEPMNAEVNTIAQMGNSLEMMERIEGKNIDHIDYKILQREESEGGETFSFHGNDSLLEENMSMGDLPTQMWLPYALGILLKENSVLKKRLSEMIITSCGLNKPLPSTTQSLDERVPLYTSPLIINPTNLNFEADKVELKNESASNINHQSLLNILNKTNTLKNDARWLKSTISVPSFSSLSKDEKLEIKIKDHGSAVLMLQKELEKIDKEIVYLKDPKQKNKK